MSVITKLTLLSFMIQVIAASEVAFVFDPQHDLDKGQFEQLNIVKVATNRELDYSQV
jgi:hypothetical protein